MPIDQLFDLAGDVAVVTGSGRGIGEGIARLLAEAGAGVVLAARRTEEIDRVAKEITQQGGRAIAVTTDVTDDGALEALARSAVDEYGKLSIWVNNAGGSPVQSPLVELPREEWDATIALNLTAVWRATAVAARTMDEGCVINITSPAGTTPVLGSGHYGAAKAGVDLLTKQLAQELAPRIRVNAVAPGAVPTEIMMTALGISEKDIPKLVRAARISLGRVGTPQDIASAVLYLASTASSWVTGQTLVVAGGM